jgi:hypothetical protein
LTEPIERRDLRWMRSFFAAMVISVGAAHLAAQTAVQLTAGLTSSGTLVTDGVLGKTLQPAIAPTVGLTIAIPTGKGGYRALLEAHYATSSLQVTDVDSKVTSDYGSLATIDALLMAEGPLVGQLRWQVGGGAIFYRPSANQGVFLDGPVQRWLVAGGLTWAHNLSPTMRLLVQGRVDSHTFTTDILVARGYAGSQGVRRFGLQVGVERTF